LPRPATAHYGTRLAHLDGMFVRRCAWHRKYQGHVKFLGVSSWQGWGVTFSDGMCSDCAVRARAEWRLPAVSPRPIVPRPTRAFWRPGVAFASVVLVATVGVTAGVLLGPPEPPTAFEATMPGSTVVASRESGETGTVAGATSAPSSAASSRVPGTPDAASPATPSQVASAPGAPDFRAVARPGAAAPIRVSRAAARRTGAAFYAPLPVAAPVEIVSAPEPVVEAPRPPARWMVALSQVAIQAP
jgi:hypothetical protein